MARNKSEKFPRVLEQRVIQTPFGERTLHLTIIHDGSGYGYATYRVALHEKKGTTWRGFDSLDEARARFNSVPAKFNGWDGAFPTGSWTCNDIGLTKEGLEK